MIHIYTAENQDATKYNLGDPIGENMLVENNPRTLIHCFTCKRKRWAKNLSAQVFYDGTYFYCKPEKGCNSPKAKSWWCTKHQRFHSPKTRYFLAEKE